MDRAGNSVGQKRRGRPFNPEGIDPVISFRMDYHLGKDLEVAQPEAQASKPLPGYSQLLRQALAAEPARVAGSSDQNAPQS